jgi:two-component system, cell cycle sensor histidine kinase and response regulator CckA
LAFSRQQLLEPKVVDLNGILTEAEAMLRRLIGENVQLITRLEPRLQPVKVDPGQIAQVIVNLAVNARDAMPRGGTLTLETRNVDPAGRR